MINQIQDYFMASLKEKGKFNLSHKSRTLKSDMFNRKH
jgi:hypothetical protein